MSQHRHGGSFRGRGSGTTSVISTHSEVVLWAIWEGETVTEAGLLGQGWGTWKWERGVPCAGSEGTPQNTFHLQGESLRSERHHWARPLCHNMSTHSPELLDRVRCSVSLPSVYKGRGEGGPASETAPGGMAEIRKFSMFQRATFIHLQILLCKTTCSLSGLDK